MFGPFYHDTVPPFISADQAAVTLSTTDKALYTAAAYAAIGAGAFNIVGKKMHIRAMGKITTGATPGNLTLSLYFGSGADANGTIIVASAAIALIASQTNLTWMLDYWISARSLGATGTLFANGVAHFNPAVIASTAQPILIPASAAVVSGSVDLTSANILSIQAKRSGSTAEAMTLQDIDVTVMN